MLTLPARKMLRYVQDPPAPRRYSSLFGRQYLKGD